MAKAKNEGLRVAAKALADLNMPDFDPQAFWVKSKVKFKTPFSIFPGIFSTLDLYQKDIVEQAFKRNGHFPPWVPADVEEQVPCPHWSKFCVTDEETGITVSGAMDDCFRKSDTTLIIQDNKLAKITDTQDKLMPLYKAQLNIYADICEMTGLGKVSQLQLVYHEPVVSLDSDEEFNGLYRGEDYLLRFKPKVVEIERDPELFKKLLRRAKEILSMENLPEPVGGRISKDVELVLEMARAFQKGMSAKAPEPLKDRGYIVKVDGVLAAKVGIAPDSVAGQELFENDPLVSIAIDKAKEAGGDGKVSWEEIVPA